MPVTIDSQARLITASVGDLAGEGSQRAIGLSGSGLSRMWIGQELHRRVQQQLIDSEPGFRAEVPVSAELEIDGWTLALTGRADGVLYGNDQAPRRVDEIKTLHFAVDLYHLFLDERLERFRRQARLYATMLDQGPGTDRAPLELRLILVDIVTGEQRHEEVIWSPLKVEAWIRQQVHRLIAAERRRLEHLGELREAARSLQFPHPAVRPSQHEIIDAATSTLSSGRHLLLSAPTGCGKTAAVLLPAMRAALEGGHRLFFLTAKTLQQRIAVETARAMQHGLFRSLQLRAKSKMCAHSEMICHEEHCPYAREYGLKLVRHQLLPTLLAEASHLDPDHIFEVARAHEVCPFEVSLDLLPEVDLVVCDYNYVFDPTIGLSSLLGSGALRNAVLLIDEAHNLVDRSREYYSPTLGLDLVRAAAPLLASRDTRLFEHLLTLVGALERLIREVTADALGPTATGHAEIQIPEEAVSELRMALDGAVLQYFIFKRENDMWMTNDPILEIFLAVTRLHRVLQLGGEELIHLAHRNDHGHEELKIFCRDASRFIGATLEESAGAVAMSATLEPFEFYQNLLGFDRHRTERLSLPSPFPPSNRLVLALPDVDTTYRRRAASYDAIAAWIQDLAPEGRNALVLFPSYAFLAAVAERLRIGSHEVLVQRPGSTNLEQETFLEALSSGEPHMVLAVLGGIFAEGVDYPGDMLSSVMVVSPGLPQISAERELLKAYYAEHYSHGFSYAYLIPGMTRVIQAAGRLIRSEEDRGVIVLLGRRFLQGQYFKLLPEDWSDGDPGALRIADPVAAARAFFAAGPQGSPGRPEG